MTKPLLVQHWFLQDIPPMHRALIRRLASNKILELAEVPNRTISWNLQNGSEPPLLSTPRFDVLWTTPTSPPPCPSRNSTPLVLVT